MSYVRQKLEGMPVSSEFRRLQHGTPSLLVIDAGGAGECRNICHSSQACVCAVQFGTVVGAFESFLF